MLLIMMAHLFETLDRLKLKMVVLSALCVGLLMGFVLLFYPFQVIVLTLAIGFGQFFYFFRTIYIRRFRLLLNPFIFLMVVGLLVLLLAFLIRNLYSQSFLTNFKQVESQIHAQLGWKLFILTMGPAIIFVLLGIPRFIRSLNWGGIMSVSFVLASYVLFFSPVDRLLGTHNGRFLSPLSYVLWGVLAVLGIQQVSYVIRPLGGKIFIFFVCILLLFSLPVIFQSFTTTINDQNINSPITYLPRGIVEAMKYVGQRPEKGNVLMTPSQFLGTILPIFADRKTYVARHIATPNYIEKNITASNFYLGAMSHEQAVNFLRNNNVKFVIWTSIEGYDIKPLYTYPFLEEVYKNKDAVIFIVKNG